MPAFVSNNLDVKRFINNNKMMCGLTLGIAIPVYCIVHWLGRSVVFLKEHLGTVAKVGKVFQKVRRTKPKGSQPKPIPNVVRDKSVADLFKEQVIRGSERLNKKGIKGSLELNSFNCLVTTMFSAHPNLEMYCHVRKSDNNCISFKIPSDRHKEKMLYGLLANPEDGCAAVKYLLNENEHRKKQGIVPFSKIILPYVCEGVVFHGILTVIEIDNNQNVNITVIDPLGKNTSYRSRADKFVDSIKGAFPLSYTMSEVVHNKIRQQTDGHSCGFQQVKNIEYCLGLDNIYEHVKAEKLSVEKRDLHSLEQWLENEMKPKIALFIK